MSCMLSTFHVSSRIVANISESSLLISQYLFRLCWMKTLPGNFYLNLFSKMLLFQVAFLIFFYAAIFSPHCLLGGLLLQSVPLFQSREIFNQVVYFVNWCRASNDWYVSWPTTVTQITAIRHWGVTNMLGDIKENPCYVVFQEKKLGLSEGIPAKYMLSTTTTRVIQG